MVTATFPFKGSSLRRLCFSILRGSYAIPEYVPVVCQCVIKGMLRLVPTDRISLSQIMSSAWLRGIEYPQAYPPASPTPAHLADPSRTLSSDERSVKLALEDLGITEAHLRNNVVLDCRSPLTGVYRILLHRNQRSGSGESTGFTTLCHSNTHLGKRCWSHPATIRRQEEQSALCAIL